MSGASHLQHPVPFFFGFCRTLRFIPIFSNWLPEEKVRAAQYDWLQSDPMTVLMPSRIPLFWGAIPSLRSVTGLQVVFIRTKAINWPPVSRVVTKMNLMSLS